MLDVVQPVAAKASEPDLQVDVFVSYSRRDSAFCVELERYLRAYRPPSGLSVPQRRLSVFRDASDLVGADYFTSIDGYLRRSRKLIVVCSPNARRSDYVNDEIRRFVETRSANDVIPLIVAGVPNNEAGPDDAAMAFPDALCAALRMPLAIDYRGFDGKANKLDRGAYAGPWYTLIASILGRSREEIEERERKRAARIRRITIGVTSAVIAVLLVFLAAALWQWREAVAERIRASARQLAAQAQLALTDAEAPSRLPAQLAMQSSLLDENSVARDALQTSLARLAPPHVADLPLGDNRLVKGAKFSPNSQYLAAVTYGHFAGEPSRIELWHVPTTRLVSTWEAAASASVFFSDDSRHLAFRRDDKRLATTIVDMDTVTVLREIDALNQSIASVNGRLYQLVAGGTASVIHVYDGIAGRVVSRISESSAIRRSALSPDGRYAATAAADAHVTVWRIADGQSSKSAQLSTKARDVIFSADGRKLAVVVDDNNVMIVDSDSGEVVDRVSSPAKILAVTFSPAAHYLLMAEDTGQRRIWDLHTHHSILAFGGRTDDVTQRAPVISIDFAGDDRSFVIARSDGVVASWSRGATMGAGMFGVNLIDHAEGTRINAGRDLRQLLASPDGRYVVTSGGGNWMNSSGTMELADFKVRVWDMWDGREVGRVTDPTPVVALSPDGRHLAVLRMLPQPEQDGKQVARSVIGVLRLTSNLERDRTILPGPDAQALDAIGQLGVLSSDGRLAGLKDNRLILWDATRGLREIALPDTKRADADRTSARQSLNFSADGQVVIVVDKQTALAFRAGDGQLVGRKTFDAALVSPPVMDREGRHAAVTVFRGNEQEAAEMSFGGSVPAGTLMTYVWDIVSGTEIAAIEHRAQAGVVGLADGGRIAALVSTAIDPDDLKALRNRVRQTAAYKSSLLIWDTRLQRATLAPIALDEVIRSVAFSDSGHEMMGYGMAMVMAVPGPAPVSSMGFRIWDVRTGRLVANPYITMPSAAGARLPMQFAPMHEQGVYGISGDGRSVVATRQHIQADGSRRIVTTRTDWHWRDLADKICERLLRTGNAPSADEVSQYMPGETYRQPCARPADGPRHETQAVTAR